MTGWREQAATLPAPMRALVEAACEEGLAAGRRPVFEPTAGPDVWIASAAAPSPCDVYFWEDP